MKYGFFSVASVVKNNTRSNCIPFHEFWTITIKNICVHSFQKNPNKTHTFAIAIASVKSHVEMPDLAVIHPLLPQLGLEQS